MNRRGLITALAVSVLCVASLSGLGARPALAACGSGMTSLQDGGFESPPVAPNTFTLFPAASVPPWLTTDSLNQIEIWGTGFLGVPAAQGNAFAEINANSAGTLYQDVVSNPGDTMSWTLQHRGRSGNDTMEVLIGDATVADVNGNTGWDFTSPGLTDGTAAWGTHTNTYVVPAGQTCTRFAFRAVSTASGNESIGNFLDDVSFAIAPAPTPTPTPSHAHAHADADRHAGADPDPDGHTRADANAHRHARSRIEHDDHAAADGHERLDHRAGDRPGRPDRGRLARRARPRARAGRSSGAPAALGAEERPTSADRLDTGATIEP